MTDNHIHVPVRVRWSDLDAYGHVNNAAMGTLLEEARIAAFWRTGSADDEVEGLDHSVRAQVAIATGGPDAPIGTFVGFQAVEYIAPISYTDNPVIVEMWIARIGGASIEINYLVRSEETVFAKAATTLVVVDMASGKPRRLDDEFRAAATRYLDDPLTFRR